ncbi:GNAT family N-acetyltransferase [Aeromicrobium sp.]|uniref:GNAT family N-acetyltransferase n=1 Tax=Aeromicrobium sp. TaxID=1871063 RepID=UPI0019C01D98|nr:GNAT family N-acetyltransferase [Aeromicrobium sp.]MBC7633731.1 GNAT family N-acetyltransferase [Aeromicrobium sp.]
MRTLEWLDPTDDAQFGEFHAAYTAAHDSQWDRPYEAHEQRAELLDDAGYVDLRGVLVREADGTVGGVGIIEMPLKDNGTLAYVSAHIVPAHRRCGHGTAVIGAFVEMARSRGRRTLFAEARWNVEMEGSGNTLFAERMGFRLDLADAHRVLDLPATMPDAPVRDGYQLRSWRGPCPVEWIDEYATLLALIVQEAPTGDYPLENEYFDAARVRSEEELLMTQRRHRQVVVAIGPDGRLAGHTQLVVSVDEGSDAFQWDTLVLREHRGHGLGLSIKVEAMRVAQDLLVGRSYVHTYNAGSNGPMIAVNEAMGFRQVGWLGEFIREL